MKTFNEIAETIKYPEYIDQPTKKLIFDFFQFREINDDERFEVYFLRQLNNYFPRYQQLLRIEPGRAQYDWFVESYNEALTTDTSTTTTAGTSTTKGTNETNNDAVTNSTAYTGNNDNKRDAVQNSSNSSNSGSSSSDPVVNSSRSSHAGNSSNKEDSYSSSIDVNAGKGLPQDSSNLITVTTPEAGKPTIATLEPKDLTHATSFNEGSTKSGTVSAGTGQTQDTNETTQNMGATASKNSATSQSSENLGAVHDVNVSTSQTTYNGGATHSKNLNNVISDTSNTASVTHENKQITTGRGSDPARILERATAYLSGTTAWDFLARKLEPCFMQVF